MGIHTDSVGSIHFLVLSLKTDVANIENTSSVDTFCTQIHQRKICLDRTPLMEYYSNTTTYLAKRILYNVKKGRAPRCAAKEILE